ncbi:MAG: fumarylacetoacetate hydrolase family protein [Dehalococcoidia bacterium]|nr:fumarylacetoacetate hydrolase family protein [Dehalococcoidia bacterium]
MKIARFEWEGTTSLGIVAGDALLAVVGDLFGEFSVGERVCGLGEARILAPVVPGKVVAVGLNYAAHVQEARPDQPVPEEPIIFLKPASSVIGPLSPIAYPKMSRRVDHEAELAIIIGKLAKNVAEEEAGEYILGYTCGNDVTARDVQRKEGQWTRAKSFDTFCPLGPYIVTGIDASNLAIECRVNGQVRQKSRTGLMVHKVEKLVSFISQVMTLHPGDVILTGTPEGIGPVRVGDVIEVEIEGIGVLQNPVG